MNIGDKVDSVNALQGLLGLNGPQAFQKPRFIHKERLNQIVPNLYKSRLSVNLKEIKPTLQVGDSLDFQIVGTFGRIRRDNSANWGSLCFLRGGFTLDIGLVCRRWTHPHGF